MPSSSYLTVAIVPRAREKEISDFSFLTFMDGCLFGSARGRDNCDSWNWRRIAAGSPLHARQSPNLDPPPTNPRPRGWRQSTRARTAI